MVNFSHSNFMTATGISFPFINSLIYEHKEKDLNQTSAYNIFTNLYFQTNININKKSSSALFASEVSLFSREMLHMDSVA